MYARSDVSVPAISPVSFAMVLDTLSRAFERLGAPRRRLIRLRGALHVVNALTGEMLKALLVTFDPANGEQCRSVEEADGIVVICLPLCRQLKGVEPTLGEISAVLEEESPQEAHKVGNNESVGAGALHALLIILYQKSRMQQGS